MVLLGLAWAAPSASGRAGEGGSTPAPVRFGRDVRPILSDRCFQCHGPDPATREAGLRLDLYESATADLDGSVAVAPGDPEGSALLDRIDSTRPGHVMPPPDSGKRPLTEEERGILRRWIEEGAEYEEHWAFEAPERPVPPSAALDEGLPARWAEHPVDRFVAAELQRAGLSPSAPAEPVVLLRRLFLELTGLPPEPSEVDAFRAELGGERSTDAVLDGWIERLLTEEPYRTRYAERMARPWLDQSRYADTSGIHMDAGRQAWAWRDWVLAAYRENKPFDEFTIEQLAGDLLPNPTTEQLVATGFNRNHVTTDEGGAISAEYLAEYAIDRVKTTGSVFLGLTVGCAQCHDHKFDPISAEEYYGLFGFFNSNDEPGLYTQRPDVNRAFEPFLEIPTSDQGERLAALDQETADLETQLATWTPEEETEWEAERDAIGGSVRWASTEVLSAEANAAQLVPQEDGSVLATGPNESDEVYRFVLRTEAADLRTLLLEALPEDGPGGSGAIGRYPVNGNAVIRSVVVTAVSVADPEQRVDVPLVWAHADYAQVDLDFEVTNTLRADDPRWWALGGHVRPGARVALYLAAEPFGFEGGTDVHVTIDMTSRWEQHTLARPRLSLGSLDEASLALLPTAFGRFHQAGPFGYDDVRVAYDTVRAPELATELRPGDEQPRVVGDGTWSWTFRSEFRDGETFRVPSNGRDVSYLGREVYAPSPRSVDLSIGSDDGFFLVLDGERLVTREVNRGVAADQDRARLDLPRGSSLFVQGIVNTGGPAGGYFRATEGESVLSPALLPLIYPRGAQAPELVADARAAWQRERSPRYAETEARLAAIADERAAIEAATPRAMVMRELETPRPTYLLMRGAYDHPDTSREIPRGVPAALGRLPEDAPLNRLGLAQWLVSRENPLTARVTVNRLWAQVFGAGLVATTDDFGLQGAWPSHPELLDWLAVEFMDSGWDVQHMLRLLLTSSTWRQASAVRPQVAAVDPEDRLLGRYPRKRLSAEAIRDQALYVSGLLVEELGGASVKPYQPEGLWREVAMVQSNTRTFERDSGDALWRRSLYTYWKRASPPPSMLTFDAPTREFCVVERSTTDTPLQALVLMNDEQFVEAARVLAQRTLAALPPDDLAATNADRLDAMFRRVLARTPEDEERALLLEAFADFRWRFLARAQDAGSLLEEGDAPLAAEVPPVDLAAWTLVASALLNLYETTNPR